MAFAARVMGETAGIRETPPSLGARQLFRASICLTETVVGIHRAAHFRTTRRAACALTIPRRMATLDPKEIYIG